MGACTSTAVWQEDDEQRERWNQTASPAGALAGAAGAGTSRPVSASRSLFRPQRHAHASRSAVSGGGGAAAPSSHGYVRGNSFVYRYPPSPSPPQSVAAAAAHRDATREVWAARQADVRQTRKGPVDRRSQSPTPPHLIALVNVMKSQRSAGSSPRGGRSARLVVEVGGAVRGPLVPPSPTAHTHSLSQAMAAGEEMSSNGSRQRSQIKQLAPTVSMSLGHIEEEQSPAAFAALSRAASFVGTSMSRETDSPETKFVAGRSPRLSASRGSAAAAAASATARSPILAGNCDSALSVPVDAPVASLPSTLLSPGTPALASWMLSVSGPMASAAKTRAHAHAHPHTLTQPQSHARHTSPRPERRSISYNPLFLSPVMSPSRSARSLPQIDSEAISAALTSFQPSDVSILLCDAEGAELECALLNAGYSVVLCEDALEAMSVLLQRPAPQECGDSSDGSDSDPPSRAPTPTADFHLVILDADASTPQGFHLLDWLRGTRYTAHLPVLVSSSDGSIASTERWLRRGVADVLRKPHVPALALSTIFTLLTQRHQQMQLPTLQQKGDRYKLELQAHVRSNAAVPPASPLDSNCSSAQAPIALNVLVLSGKSRLISSRLLDWLGTQFLLNLIPCDSTEQVLQHLRQPRGHSFLGASAPAHASAISDRLIGSLGADLLLLDEMLLGDSDADCEFAAAVTSRPHSANDRCLNGHPAPASHSGDNNAHSLPPCQCLMVPLMLLADSDSSAPALSLLSLLQRSLVGVLEMPLSAAIVQSKLGAFLRAVEQHRRRFQLAQRAHDYREALRRMRSFGGGRPHLTASRPSVSISDWRSNLPSPLQLPLDPLVLPAPMQVSAARITDLSPGSVTSQDPSPGPAVELQHQASMHWPDLQLHTFALGESGQQR